MSKKDLIFSVVCSIGGTALGYGIYGDSRSAAIGFALGLLIIPICWLLLFILAIITP